MNTVFILDKDSQTELSKNLRDQILGMLVEKGHKVEMIELGKNDQSPCVGCFLCVTKHLGECISKDIVNEIKSKIHTYDMTIFMTPIIFGHFSSTIKNAIDRGAGSHNLQVMIGYGSDIDNEEKNTFIDLIARHRGSADIVHPGMDKQVDVYVTMSFEDNTRIREKLINFI